MELKVSPQINDAALVTLDVDEVEGSAIEANLAGGPITSGRNIQSHVMVADGQTIVLAGVTGTKVDITESKVPILGDIPLIAVSTFKPHPLRRSYPSLASAASIPLSSKDTKQCATPDN